MFYYKEHAEIRAQIELIGTPIWIVEVEHAQPITLVSCNASSLAIVELPMAEIINQPLSHILPQYLANQISDAFTATLARNEPQHIEITVNHRGVNRWWKATLAPVSTKKDAPKRVFITYIDISDVKALQKALEKANSRFKAIVDSAHDGIISIDTNEMILFANNAAQEIFQNNQLVGQSINSLLPHKFRAKHSQYLKSFEHSNVPSRPMHMRADVMGLRKDGSEVPLEISIARISVDGETEMTALVRDTTEKNKLMRELNHISTIDKLTSLYNRRYADPLVNTEFERAKRYDSPLSLLFIDIDHFKRFNDNYGHSMGDKILQNVASTIHDNIRDIDSACRWGGEEILVVAPELSAEAATILAERLRSAVEATEIEYKMRMLSVTVSIGIVSISEQYAKAEDLIEAADKNMYAAKRQGRNRVYAG